jgi:hypothetical protein
MRITQHNKLIRLANNSAEKVNLNRHDMRTLLDEKIYALEFMFDSFDNAGA